MQPDIIRLRESVKELIVAYIVAPSARKPSRHVTPTMTAAIMEVEVRCREENHIVDVTNPRKYFTDRLRVMAAALERNGSNIETLKQHWVILLHRYLDFEKTGQLDVETRNQFEIIREVVRLYFNRKNYS